MATAESPADRPLVLIVDDHPMWLQTLRKVIDRRDVGQIVGEATDGAEAIALAAEATPDVVLMDLDLPGLGGVEATRLLTDRFPEIRVLVLSASDRRDDVVAAVQAGASGYLLKTAAPSEVADAVRRIHAGELVFPPELADVLLDEFRRRGDGGPASPASSPGTPGQNVFVLEGEYWTVVYDGVTARFGDLKGMHDLAALLAVPGREVLAVDLVAAREGEAVTPFRPDVDGMSIGELGDAGSVLDGEARRAYRARLAELQDVVEEAEAMGDDERAARAREELQVLSRQLTEAVGLGGRDRRSADNAERARLSVTRAIRRALERIAEGHPQLGDHLDRSVHTGTYCSYDPERAITWRLTTR